MAKVRFAAQIAEQETPAPKPAVKAPSKASSPNVSTGNEPVSVPRPDRAEKKAVIGYFHKEVSRALHMIALEEETTVQALLGEGINHVLRSRNKHPLAG